MWDLLCYKFVDYPTAVSVYCTLHILTNVFIYPSKHYWRICPYLVAPTTDECRLFSIYSFSLLSQNGLQSKIPFLALWISDRFPSAWHWGCTYCGNSIRKSSYKLRSNQTVSWTDFIYIYEWMFNLYYTLFYRSLKSFAVLVTSEKLNLCNCACCSFATFLNISKIATTT